MHPYEHEGYYPGRMSSKKNKPAGTPALLALEKAGVEFTILEYEQSLHHEHGFALDSAAELGMDPRVIFKTLLARVDGKAVCAVVPAAAMLNLKSLAKAAGGKKAAMMDPHDAEKLTGYVTGGISPLGQKHRSPIFIDASARELPAMVVSGGKRGLSVRLAPADLAAAARAEFAPVADFSRHI